MSAQTSSSGGPYRKPRLDIYTVMLALALAAIIIACIVLYFEVADYGKPPYELGLAAPEKADSQLFPGPPDGYFGQEVAAPLLLPCWKTTIHG